MPESEGFKLFYTPLIATESSARLLRVLGYIVEAFGGLSLFGTSIGVVVLAKDDSVDGGTVVAWGISALFASIPANC